MKLFIEILQNVALVLALQIALGLSGLNPSVWQWVIIVVALMAALAIGEFRAREGRHTHHMVMTAAEFDEWLRAKGVDPKEFVEKSIKERE